MLKRLILALFCLIVFLAAEIKPSNTRALPQHMKSYKNYLIVLVHGMQADAGAWDLHGLRDELAKLTGDNSFREHIFAYSFNDPYASYQQNAPQLGDRNKPECWLTKARQEFINRHPDLPGDKIPQKFILITHSMGALAARSYIYSDTLAASGVDPENFPYGFYQNDVKKVVFIAPTHTGSSMADFVMHYLASDDGYKMWPSTWLKDLIKNLELKNDSFESAWNKAKNYAEKKFEEYKAELINRSWEYLQQKPQVYNDESGAINTEIILPELKLKNYVNQFAQIAYELDTIVQATTNFKVINQAQLAAQVKKDVLKQLIKEDLKKSLLEYAQNFLNGSEAAGSAAYNKNDWFKKQIESALVKAIDELTDNIYQEAKKAEADLNAQIQAKTFFKDWQELVEYITYLNEQWILLSQKNQNNNFDLSFWINQQIKAQTGFNSWSELKAFIESLKIGEELERAVAEEMGKRQELDDIHVLYNTLIEQNKDSEQRKKLDELVSRYTRFKTYAELYNYLVELKLEEKLAAERDLIIRQNTDFADWDQLAAFLKSISITAELKKALDREIALRTGFNSWEDLYAYLQSFSLQVYAQAQTNILIKQYTGFESFAELQSYLANLDLKKEWDKFFLPIKNQMETEGYYFTVEINVDKNWPFQEKPRIKLQWHNWTTLTPDLKLLETDINRMLNDYKFKIKVTDEVEFNMSLDDIKKKMAELSAMQNPLNRLYLIITEIDTAQLWSFPTIKILMEVNNYCASDEVKKFLDYAISQVVLKKAIQGGAVPALAKANPATKVLKTARLPDIYDPVEYRNIIPSGLVAFDQKETTAFNQFFYGDSPALRGAFKEVESFARSGFMPTVIANAYQLKLITSAKYQNLPSGEARLAAVMLSYARGIFTKEGDGTIDLDSLRGNGVVELSGAENYYEKFITSEVSEYVDSGFLAETLEAEAVCQLVELAFNLYGGTTPPYVRGAIRLLPLFHFISIVVNNQESLADDIMAHERILKPERSLSHIEKSLYDDPLIVLKNIYIVSGNNKTALGLESLQERTDSDQALTTVPLIKDELIYIPYAYNIKDPKIEISALLYDFAPNLANLEYSFNFAAFKRIPADEWGNLVLPDLAIAEGQNILVFKTTNKVGRTNTQYLRIIRSSTPLIASGLSPAPFEYINRSTIAVSAKFYNAQFITNNVNASQFDEVIIDGQNVALNSLQYICGQDQAYRNYLQLATVQTLGEGEHQVEIRAHDIYGHSSYTRWPFFVDLTPPKIRIGSIGSFSPSVNSELEVDYQLNDNFAPSLKNITIELRDSKNKTVYHHPLIKELTCGPQKLLLKPVDDYNTPLSDGTYQLSITGFDRAGNKATESMLFIIDTQKPQIKSAKFDQLFMSKKFPDLKFELITNEIATVYFQAMNLDKKQKYTYVLPNEAAARSDYCYKQTFKFDPAGYFEWLDGHYQITALVVDNAGNVAKSVTQDLIVDCTGPVISGMHAEPMVLANYNTNPYGTNIEYFAQADLSPTCTVFPKALIKVKATIINKSTNTVVTELLNLTNNNGTNSFSWSAAAASILRGAYTIVLQAEDIYGNQTQTFCEVIKEGIAPEISFPKRNISISGITSIIGKVSDSDWTNIKSFESYELYWACGKQLIPTDLNNLDKSIWSATGLEVPYINRKPDQINSNVSYRPAEQNTLIGYWDTNNLADGEYTLLIIAKEQDIGATAGTICPIKVDNSNLSQFVAPKIFLQNKISTMNFTVSKNINLTLLNTNKKANIGAEIIAPDNTVAKYFYFSEIAGLTYYGCPEYLSGQDTGVYIWQDQNGWHLRLNGSATQETSYKITLAGVDSIKPAKVAMLAAALKSGLANMSGKLAIGEERGFDFNLQPNISSIYIDVLINNKTAEQIAQNGSDIYLGAGKYQAQHNPYILVISGQEKEGFCNLIWDGKNSYGGYAENGEYRLRISGSGADGYGFMMQETTFNVLTPFVLAKKSIVPNDQQFDTFSPSFNSINAGYSLNKDSYVTAKIYAENNQLITVLLDNKKILGGSAERSIIWNGAFPNPDSTQRKVSGNYYLLITAKPLDHSPDQTIEYKGIKIQNNCTNSINLDLNPLGQECAFNASKVRAASGSSEYYWSARASGTYSIPKSFSYVLEASGQQEVSVNPFVPFAGLYHRGFNKVKNIRFDFYMRYYEGVAGNGNADSRNGGSSGLEITTKNCINYGFHFHEENGFGRFDQGHINVYLDNILMASYKLTSFYGITETYNRGVLRVKGFSASRYPDNNRNASVLRNYDCGIQIDLLDNIKYSRLTNRYYAWYGFVNKDTGRTLDFSPWWNDLGKLGFVPISYFVDPKFSEKIKPLTKGALCVTLNNQSVIYDPRLVQEAQGILAAIQQENVLYESFHCTDNSYYNYLADEYCEFIPMALPVPINYLSHYRDPLAKKYIDTVSVETNYSRKILIPWPLSEAEVIATINSSLIAAAKIINPREITAVDYNSLPKILDIKSVDFGGLGSSRQEIFGFLSKHEVYKKRAVDVFKLQNKYAVKLKIDSISDPDIELLFENGAKEINLQDLPQGKIIAQYKTGAGLDTIKSWASEMDPFLKNGLIDSEPIIFNQHNFAPKSEYIAIAEAYFNSLNRPENTLTQNIHPIDYYTFLEHSFTDGNSGLVNNPNLELTKWDIAIYDKTGQTNKDLEISDIQRDNENVFNNKFKVKLKLDAVEKRFIEINGAASGPYELLYFDGISWQTIATSNSAAAGRLGWWNVGRLNGKYTVALKVYEKDFGASLYNIKTQEVFIGELLKYGDNSLENKKVSSPYKRAEVYFHPQSYDRDMFITVTPVNLNELDLQNKPEIYTLGPIAEILPHGSKFPEADKRPVLVYRYSHEDIVELQRRGIDIRNISLYYLNESGDLEKADSELTETDYGIEIRTALNHFSPYALLEGDVPPLPKVAAAFTMASAQNIKIYGMATANAVLEVYVDDDNIFGDQDGIKTIRQLTATSNLAAWIFDGRKWSEDYITKLPDQEKAAIISQRNSQYQNLERTIAQNKLNSQQIQIAYNTFINSENISVSKIKNFLDQQELVATTTIRDIPLNNPDNKVFRAINNSSGISRITNTGLKLNCQVPTLNSCAPNEFKVHVLRQEMLQQGYKARKYYVQADRQGRFESFLPILTTTRNTNIYVTYPLSAKVKNRPVARISIGQDPNAPQIKLLQAGNALINKYSQSQVITFNVKINENGKINIMVFDDKNNLLKTDNIPMVENALMSGIIDLNNYPEGKYHCLIMAVDNAGNSSFPWEIPVLIDTLPPSLNAFYLAQSFNPQTSSLNLVIKDPEEIADFKMQVFYQGIFQAELNKNKLNFEPVRAGNNFANSEYTYLLELKDRAGNTANVSGKFTVDTVNPDVPENFSILEEYPTGVQLHWDKVQNPDLNGYILTAQHKSLAKIITKNVKYTTYFMDNVSENCFHRFTVQAVDLAGNQSAKTQPLTAYLGRNKQTVWAKQMENATVSYNRCLLKIPYNSADEDNLYVVQELNDDNLYKTQIISQKKVSPVYRLLASERDIFNKNLSLEIKFNPSEIELIRQGTLRIAFWNGKIWSAEGLQNNAIDLTKGIARTETNHFTDFALIGELEYRVFDTDLPSLSFENLRNGDFLDTAATLNLLVQDLTSPINTGNMRLTLDNVSYVIPAINFISEQGGSGVAGKIAINLNQIAGNVLEGNHSLTVYVADSAANTADIKVSFTNKAKFEIKEIMNVPNPFDESGTHFTYQLSKPAESIKIKIYTTNGKLVKEITDCANASGFNKTFWDGRDENNMFVANDVYIYTVLVESPDGEKEIFKGKAAALR